MSDHASRVDLGVSSMAYGFTIGFGLLTTWEAIKQTLHARSPLRSMYIWMVWGEIFVCFMIGILVYLLFCGVFELSVQFLFGILVLWTLKLHFVIQIIVNRISIIETDRKWVSRLRWGSAVYILILNISVFCIWIPAQMQVNETYMRINNVWDRMTKVLYLVVDGGLNYIFVRTVRNRLVNNGIVKYDKLVKFNIKIIFVSLAMDLVILGTMSYPNSLVYTQFHPLAFIVKLRIELSMAKLIRKIATQKTDVCSSCTFELSTTRSGKGNGRQHAHGQCNHNGNKSTIESVPRRGSEALPKNQVIVHRTVMVDNERPPSRATGVSDMSAVEEGRSSAGGRGFEEDEDRILKQDGRW